jgi:hypothetical protein
MSRIKKTVRLRSVEERRQSSQAKRATKPSNERLVIRQVLARHEIAAATKKIIEDLAVEYGPALKRLTDR